MQKRLTLIEVIIIVVVIGASIAMFIPAINASRERNRRISCASQLKCIGLALFQYSMDFNDYFPNQDHDGGFELLRSNDYLTDNKIYACPSTSDTGNVGGAVISSYNYQSGFTSNDKIDSGFAWDKLNNHRKFGNLLFLDGHVTGYAGPNWTAPGNTGWDILKVSR